MSFTYHVCQKYNCDLKNVSYEIRTENFRMVDIEINAWSSLFLYLETNLILYLYPEKYIKFNQSESRIRSREIKNFARHLQRREGLSNFEKPVF